MGKLLQFCNGAVYGNDGKVVPVHDCKLEAYTELLEQLNGEHCLTFYGYQHDKDRILERLEKYNRGRRTSCGSGCIRAWRMRMPGTPERWMCCWCIRPLAPTGSTSRPVARHVVWYGLNWSFELNDQGNCRLYRQGSPYEKVFVHYLIVQGCEDEDVMATIRDRADTHEAVMRALKARIRKVKESVA